jgi:hypothetical protein
MEARLSESGSMADSPGLKHEVKAVIIRQHGRQSRAKTRRKGLSESGSMADSPGLKHEVKAVIIRQHGRQSRAKMSRKGCHYQAAWQKVQG